jgi:hypothetical protein
MSVELARRARDEWLEIDRILAVGRGPGWSLRHLCGKCEIVVDKREKFITFEWPRSRTDLTLADGKVVVCEWKTNDSVVVAVFDRTGKLAHRTQADVSEFDRDLSRMYR